MHRPFKLEAVLTQRRYREDAARKQFADAVRELSRAQSALDRQENDRLEYRRAMRSKQEGGGSAMEILMYARYLHRLDEEIRDQRKRTGALAKAKESKRRELMMRVKDRKVIEKLKERHLADLEKQERAQEQKALGEVAISRYLLRS